MDFTDEEVRLLIDICKGEEMRLHQLRRDEPDGTYPGKQGSWFEIRVDAVAALKDRLKGERFRRSTPPPDIYDPAQCSDPGCLCH